MENQKGVVRGQILRGLELLHIFSWISQEIAPSFVSLNWAPIRVLFMLAHLYKLVLTYSHDVRKRPFQWSCKEQPWRDTVIVELQDSSLLLALALTQNQKFLAGLWINGRRLSIMLNHDPQVSFYWLKRCFTEPSEWYPGTSVLIPYWSEATPLT